jgi:hypothetical protein
MQAVLAHAGMIGAGPDGAVSRTAYPGRGICLR